MTVSQPFPEVMGPSLETTGGAVQQPGVVVAHGQGGVQPDIKHDPHNDPIDVRNQASDKFAVVTMVVDASRPFQLLPADYRRKSAVITCFLFGIYVGDISSISNALGFTAAGTIQAPSVFQIPLLTALQYTSKQGLYCCSAGGVGTSAQVQAMVERFDTGTPIT
jgi:hypothetical protein